ncbi:MAG: YbaK/EbsC family protein [Caldilineaceae bacterium]|nr:YbaK/EbsC family protein [Caldilineaceae bacterium]HRJ45644.1 YbaK/EbsC family protein [Caldilineaceae bacterium]
MPTPPPVSLALTALDIPHRLFVHPGPVSSLEQAAAERGQTPEQVVRSLLFRLEEGRYVMVLAAGPAQIDWTALRAHLGVSRLTTADRDEVQTVTGYPIGAVAPFGMATPVPVLVDSSVAEQSEVSIGSGVRGTTVILSTADLLAALGETAVLSLRSEKTD